MQNNKKQLIILVMALSLLLLITIGYPAVDEHLQDNQKKDIFPQQAQASGAHTGAVSEQAVEAPLSETNPGKPLPEMTLTLENEALGFQVTLWQSDTDICYFFLPGFARNKGLLLENKENNLIYINDTEVGGTDVLHGILEDTPYDLSVTDPDGNVIWRKKLYFMFSSSLPVMSLTTKSGNMDYINADKANEEAGAAALFDETGLSLYSGNVEAIRGRGNSTWGLSKKPYQIKLQEDADFFGFGPAHSFNLIANGYDETKLRNRIASDLAAALDMDYIPDSQMIDLYINHIYYGNYYLTEKIRVDEAGVDIQNMDTYVDAAYDERELEKLERQQNEDGTRKWVVTDIEPDDLTGGYLLERELSTRFETEISGFVTDQGDCYTLQSPSYASESQVNYIADLMQAFQDAVEQPDGRHPETGAHYSEYIDTDSFIQKYLVEEISKNYDGGVTSSFFYKPHDAVSKKLFAGPIWDYDVAFGNCNLDKIASNPLRVTKLHDHIYSTEIFAQLYAQEDFYNRTVDMYEEKALPYLNDLLNHGLNELSENSRASVAMDGVRWNVPENRYQYYQEYDNSVRYLKYFIETRRDFLNEVWLEGVTYHNLSFTVDGEVWQVQCVRDGELPSAEPIPVRYSSPSLFLGWVNEYGVPFDAYKPIYEDMTFQATWAELPVKAAEGQTD